MTTAHDFTVRALDGAEVPLSSYAGRVLLIVNTASRCSLTPQYAGLEALQRSYAARGFAVLGFPCNQFGAQEPGTADQIAGFCSTKYDVTFPLFAKIDVNGANAAPLWAWLKAQKPGILGIEAHRAKPEAAPEDAIKTGYLPEAWVIAQVEAAGFKLAGKSEINANPKDTKDYAEGVWTLPPSFELKDKDHDKYAAIGESDRMTLKFTKVAPKAAAARK